MYLFLCQYYIVLITVTFQNSLKSESMIPLILFSFLNIVLVIQVWGFPGGSDGKASAHNAGDQGSFPGSGRSPGEGNGNPLQYSCLENPMDGGAW